MFPLRHPEPDQNWSAVLGEFCTQPSGIQKEACRVWGQNGDEEGLRRACALDDADSCASLAKVVKGTVGRERSITAAKVLSDRACEIDPRFCEKANGDSDAECSRGSIEQCFEAGRRYAGAELGEFARISKEDWAHAKGAFEKSCQGNHAAACAGLGDLLREGRGQDKDLPGSIAPYSRACAAGIKTACGTAAALSSEQRACEQSNPPRCQNWSTRLASFIVTESDLQRALKLLQLSCETKQTDACQKLVQWATNGTGEVPPNPKAGASLALLAKKWGADSPEIRAGIALGNALAGCEKQAMHECTTTASLLSASIERTPRRDSARAEVVSLGGKACDLGDSKGCMIAVEAALWEPVLQPDEARKRWERACNLGAAESCFSLGEELRVGGVLAQDERRALQAFERGCELKSADSCFRVGEALHEGLWGASKDAAAASSKLRYACDLGAKNACAMVE